MDKHKKSKGSKRVDTQWSDWTDWIWSNEYQRYYRQRQDHHENIQTQWEGTANLHEDDLGGEHLPATSGGSAQVDSLTEELEGLKVDPNDSGYTSKSSRSAYSHSTKSSSKDKSKSVPRKGKGKSRGYDDPEGQDPDPVPDPPPTDPFFGAKQGFYSSGTRDHYTGRSGYGAQADQQSYPSYEFDPASNEEIPLPSGREADYVDPAGYGQSYGQEEYDPYGEEADYDTAVRASQHSSRRGESSSKAAYAPVDSDGEQGQRTPRAGGPKFDISGKEGDYEDLDPRYRVENSGRFQPGEVFKILWSEPSGAIGGTPTISDKREFRDQYGQRFFVGFRRFIVIANDAGHCTCVPILTYGGKGCKKKGVKPEKHGVVYQLGHRARQMDGEPKMGFLPVRLIIEAEGEKLAKESRINYSKLVTVEHNVKVFFIGHILPEDYQLVSDAVNTCWDAKIHQRRKNTKYP